MHNLARLLILGALDAQDSSFFLAGHELVRMICGDADIDAALERRRTGRQAAMDAVKQWKYKPYSVDGEAVEADTEINVKFTPTNKACSQTRERNACPR